MSKRVRTSPKVKKALAFAKKAHKGQKRTSGEPYVNHVIAVADLLIKDLHADEESVIAALLHDTAEDTHTTLDDIEEAFGPTVSHLVEGVTKAQQFENEGDKKERNLHAIRKLFRTMGADIRVIFIKLADRLHNMQTIGYVPLEKQRRIARETQDIYVPVADLLGIRPWYQQLSNACFRVLQKTDADLIEKKSEQAWKEQGKQLNHWLQGLQRQMRSCGFPKATLSLHKRHLESVHHEAYGQEVLLQNVETFHTVHIVIPDSQDCYGALGCLHQFASPLPHHITDYIATPKMNGYQALHTTVVTTMGNAINIIIQNKNMETQAQYGIATLYGQKHKKDQVMELPAWLEILTTLEKDEEDLQLFFSMIQSEIFGKSNRAYAGKSKKKPVDLPVHASLLDFSYYLSKQTGTFAHSALVNGKKVNLKYIVREGDIIELQNDEKSPRTAQDLQYLHTSLGQKQLIGYLSGLPDDEKLKRGNNLLEQAISVAIDPFFSITWQKQIRSQVQGQKDMMRSIGTGLVDPFSHLEENSEPQDYLLLDARCFQATPHMLPSSVMHYVLRTSFEELRSGKVTGIQSGPDVIEVVSSTGLAKDYPYVKEVLPLKTNKQHLKYPLFFSLKFGYDTDANPLQDISTLQNILDTPVNILRFEPGSVTLGFHTDRLRTVQIAHGFLFGLPYTTDILRLTP